MGSGFAFDTCQCEINLTLKEYVVKCELHKNSRNINDALNHCRSFNLKPNRTDTQIQNNRRAEYNRIKATGTPVRVGKWR